MNVRIGSSLIDIVAAAAEVGIWKLSRNTDCKGVRFVLALSMVSFVVLPKSNAPHSVGLSEGTACTDGVHIPFIMSCTKRVFFDI